VETSNECALRSFEPCVLSLERFVDGWVL